MFVVDYFKYVTHFYFSNIGTYAPTPKQDVVKVEFIDEEPVVQIPRSDRSPASDSFAASLELVIGSSNLRISNQADPELLAQIIFLLRDQ